MSWWENKQLFRIAGYGFWSALALGLMFDLGTWEHRFLLFTFGLLLFLPNLEKNPFARLWKK